MTRRQDSPGENGPWERFGLSSWTSENACMPSHPEATKLQKVQLSSPLPDVCFYILARNVSRSLASGGNSKARGNNKAGVYRLSIGNPERGSAGSRNSSSTVNSTDNDTRRSRSSTSSLQVERKGRRPLSSERGVSGSFVLCKAEILVDATNS